MSKSSHQKRSTKKGVLKNIAKFTGKQLCQSLFFNKVAGLRPATLLKKRLWHRRFPTNFAIFLRTLSWQNTSGRLRLVMSYYHWRINWTQNFRKQCLQLFYLEAIYHLYRKLRSNLLKKTKKNYTLKNFKNILRNICTSACQILVSLKQINVNVFLEFSNLSEIALLWKTCQQLYL